MSETNINKESGPFESFIPNSTTRILNKNKSSKTTAHSSNTQLLKG